MTTQYSDAKVTIIGSHETVKALSVKIRALGVEDIITREVDAPEDRS